MKHKDVLNLVDQLIDSDTPIADRRIKKAKQFHAGKNTGLNQSTWLATIFELNELHAMRGEYEKVLHDRQIMHNWDLEFGRHLRPSSPDKVYSPGGGLRTGKTTIGMFRRRYRLGKLFKDQPKPILMSFRYAKSGEPRKDGRTLEMLTLNDCRQSCLQYKIADPRFFDVKELLKLRLHAKDSGVLYEWGICSNQQFEELTTSVVGGVFNSIKIYDNPYNDEWSPPEDDD